MKKLLILIACSLSIGLQAQIDPSDGCAGVPFLPVNASCTYNTFNMPGTFANGGLVMSTTCVSGLNQDDGWYAFTATSTSTTINLTGDRLKALVIWTSCGGGTQVACSEATAGVTATLTFPTTIGTTYYVQVHRRGGGNTAAMAGSICIYQTPVAAACVPNTVIASIPYTQTGMNTAGSGDDFSSADACGSSYMNGDDYTFSYTPSVSQCVTISLSNTATWVGLFVTDGCPSAGGVTCVASSTSSSGNPTVSGVNLAAGITYFFTVSTWPSPQTTPFDINIFACPPPPANDECVTATPVPVNPTNICATSVAGTIGSATASWQANACGGTDDDDVWYSFVATNPTQLINLNNVAGSTTDLYHSVYSGTCGALGAALVCSDPNNSVVTGLIPGNTYYVRVYSWTSTPGQTTTFDICIGTPPPPPANDNCGGAIPVTVSNTSCNYTTGTIYSATPSTQANGCGGTADDDVWYSFVATSPSVNITLTNITGGTTDLYHSVYAGSCGAPGAALVCSDPNTSTVTGLTVGNTYFVRVYSWTSTAGQTSVFDLCILAAGACGTPNNQDYCVAPAILTPGTSFSSNTSGTYTPDIPANLGSIFCGSIENNSWYEFVATSTTATFPIVSVTGCTYGIQAQVYAVTENVNGCCTNFASVSNCYNPASLALGTVTATGLTIGNTYVLMVDGNGGSICDFTISGWNGTGILPVELVAFTGVGLEEYNALKWSTASEVENDHFNVLRSLNGIDFEKIGELQGAGTTLHTTNYSFNDSDIRSGVGYYQLEQVDVNGQSTKSNTIAIDRSKIQQNFINVFPNPTENVVYIELGKEQEGGYIQLIDTRGEMIQEIQLGSQAGKQIVMDLSEVMSGMYMIRLIEEDGTVTTKKITRK